jgi:hypothetical protein
MLLGHDLKRSDGEQFRARFRGMRHSGDGRRRFRRSGYRPVTKL